MGNSGTEVDVTPPRKIEKPIPLAYATNNFTTRQSWVPVPRAALIALAAFLLFGVSFIVANIQRGEESSSAATTGLASIELAIDAFSADTGRPPTVAEGLDALLKAPPGIANWHGPYLTRRPVDPWGQPYVYHILPGGKFEVCSNGPDGKPGTHDDVTDRP